MLVYVKKVKAALEGKFNIGKRIQARSAWLWNVDYNKVIKVVDDPDPLFGSKLMCLLRYLQATDSPAVVKVHEFGLMNIKVNNNPCYYYLMDKLKPIPHDVFEDIFEELLVDLYRTRRKVPVFISKEFKDFLREAKKLKYKYYDLHSRNVMIDDQGKFRFIDLESFL